MEKENFLKKFWNFLCEDSWPSLVVSLVIALIVIKFILFPVLSLLTGTYLPLVIVESCSMHHYENGFDKIFSTSNVYSEKNISLSETSNWPFQNGFNKGDVIFVVGAKNVNVGDVIIFNGGAANPIIHRVVSLNPIETKGDNYITNPAQLPAEKNINKNQIIGKAVFRIPYIGWLKLIFYEFARPESERGICS